MAHLHLLIKYNIYYSISNRFFKNQPNEICSHLSEKASKSGFLKPARSSKITVTKEKETAGKERAGRTKGGEEEKAMVALLVFTVATLSWLKKNCWTEKVHMTITFSKIRLHIYSYVIHQVGAKNVRGKMQSALLTN